MFLIDLEGEMYQLSHLLTEQASLLNSLASSSIVGEQNSNSGNDINGIKNDEIDNVVEEKRIQKLRNIMERVENCNVSIFFINCSFSRLHVVKVSIISLILEFSWCSWP